jgi:hypothetical protein
MARLAEMGISPAKPLSNATAKFAFELYEIFAVLGTVFHRNLTAIRTY